MQNQDGHESHQVRHVGFIHNNIHVNHEEEEGGESRSPTTARKKRNRNYVPRKPFRVPVPKELPRTPGGGLALLPPRAPNRPIMSVPSASFHNSRDINHQRRKRKKTLASLDPINEKDSDNSDPEPVLASSKDTEDHSDTEHTAKEPTEDQKPLVPVELDVGKINLDEERPFLVDPGYRLPPSYINSLDISEDRRDEKFSILIELFKLTICVWLLTGLVLWLTFVTCIVLKIAYDCYRPAVDVLQWPLVVVVGYFSLYAYYFIKTLTHTFLRMVMSVWAFEFSKIYFLWPLRWITPLALLIGDGIMASGPAIDHWMTKCIDSLNAFIQRVLDPVDELFLAITVSDTYNTIVDYYYDFRNWWFINVTERLQVFWIEFKNMLSGWYKDIFPPPTRAKTQAQGKDMFPRVTANPNQVAPFDEALLLSNVSSLNTSPTTDFAPALPNVEQGQLNPVGGVNQAPGGVVVSPPPAAPEPVPEELLPEIYVPKMVPQVMKPMIVKFERTIIKAYNRSKNPLLTPLTDKIRRSILMSAIISIFGTTCYVVSFIFGYWNLISNLSMSFCFMAALLILLINAYQKAKRFRKVLFSGLSNAAHSKIKNDAFIRCLFIASVAFDDGSYVVDQLLRFVKWSGVLMVVSYWLFWTPILSANSYMFYIGLAGFVVGLVLRKIRRMGFYFKWEDSTYIQTKGNAAYYTGRKAQPVVLTLFMRTIVLLTALASCVYFDNYWKSFGGSVPPRYDLGQMIGFACAFLVLFILRDLCMIWPIEDFEKKHPGNNTYRSLHLLLLYCIIGLIIILASENRVFYLGLTGNFMVIYTYVNMDYRYPKYFWAEFETLTQRISRIKAQRSLYLARDIILLVLFILFSSIFISYGYTYASNSQKSIAPSLSSYGYVTNQPTVCKANYYGLSAVDLAMMNSIVYNTSLVTGQPIPNLESRPDFTNFFIGRVGTQYTEFKNGGLSVIAVKATTTAATVFDEYFMWSTSILLQTSSYAGTLFNWWPLSATAQFTAAVTACTSDRVNMLETAPIEAYARNLTGSGRTVILTGHSSGAAIIAIIAGRMGIPAIGFSGPGVGMQSALYNFDPTVVDRVYVNIVPDNDVIATLDVQLGLVQKIPCVLNDAIACHSISNTYKTLQYFCGEK